MSYSDLIRRGDALVIAACGAQKWAIDAILALPAVAREPFSTVPIDTKGRDVVVVGAGPGAVVRDVSRDDPAEVNRIARKAIEDYIAGRRDSHGKPTSDWAEVQIAAADAEEPLLLEKLGRAKSIPPAPRPNLDAVVDAVRRAESPSPPTCARCGGRTFIRSPINPGLDEACPACAGGRRA